MESHPAALNITLEPNEAHRLASLCGQFDDNLRLIEQRLKVEIRSRGNFFAIYGEAEPAQHAADVIYNLYQHTAHSNHVSPEEVHLHLRQYERRKPMDQSANTIPAPSDIENFSVIRTKKGNIKPRGLNQQRYVRAMQTHDKEMRLSVFYWFDLPLRQARDWGSYLAIWHKKLTPIYAPYMTLCTRCSALKQSQNFRNAMLLK